MYIVIVARPDSRGVIDEKAFRVHLFVERVSAAWAISAVLMCVVQAANDSGVAVTRLVRSTAMLEVIAASEMSRAWIATALCAAVVAIAVRLTLRWVSHCVLVLPTLVGVVALPVSGNAASGPDHDYATSAAIVFALALAVLTGIKVVAVLSPPSRALYGRVLLAECLGGAVALVYGAMLLSLLLGSGGITATDYWAPGPGGRGQRPATDVGRRRRENAGLASPINARRQRWDRGGRRARHFRGLPRSRPWRSNRAAAADPPVHRVGRLPGLCSYPILRMRFGCLPSGVSTSCSAWRPLVLAARLRDRGAPAAPPRRPLAARTTGRVADRLCGAAVRHQFGCHGLRVGDVQRAHGRTHGAEHVHPGLPGPGRADDPGAAGASRCGRRSAARPAGMAAVAGAFAGHGSSSHPVTAFMLFVGSLYVVYFTPVFDTLVRYHWGHEFMSLHFLITGYLFFWAIIGIDPGPRRLPFLGRLGLLFAVMPFHAFFGIATMTMTSTIGGHFYRSSTCRGCPASSTTSISGARSLGAQANCR